MTVKEGIERLVKEGCIEIEGYHFNSSRKSIHTDFIEVAELDSIEALNSKAIEVHAMDMEDYDHTILANSSLSHEDLGYDDDVKVGVIVY